MVIPAEGADDVGVAMVDGALVTKKVGQAQSPQPPLAHTLYTERKKRNSTEACYWYWLTPIVTGKELLYCCMWEEGLGRGLRAADFVG